MNRLAPFATIVTAVTTLLLSQAFASAADIAFGDNNSLPERSYLKLGFQKVAGKTYTICVTSLSGDADLYTDYRGWATKADHQYQSIKTDESDCVSFKAKKTGEYYYTIYAASDTTFNFFVYEQ